MPSILVVDDNEEARECLTLLLQTQGVTEVSAAASAEEALDRSKQQRFGLVICDYYLEGMDGVEFVEAFRARGDTAPVLILTGSTDATIKTSVARHERVGVFNKPFQFHELTGQIDKLLAP